MAKQTPAGKPAECGIVHTELEIAIDASPARVWLALVEETGRWWHQDFYTHPLARGFSIEAKVGGRVFEDWGEGSGCLWGTVIVCEPGRVVEWAGDLSPSFGGPARTMVRLEVAAKGAGSVLKVRDAIFGRVDGATAGTMEEGWKVLFGELKKWSERG